MICLGAQTERARRSGVHIGASRRQQHAADGGGVRGTRRCHRASPSGLGPSNRRPSGLHSPRERGARPVGRADPRPRRLPRGVRDRRRPKPASDALQGGGFRARRLQSREPQGNSQGRPNGHRRRRREEEAQRRRFHRIQRLSESVVAVECRGIEDSVVANWRRFIGDKNFSQ